MSSDEEEKKSPKREEKKSPKSRKSSPPKSERSERSKSERRERPKSKHRRRSKSERSKRPKSDRSERSKSERSRRPKSKRSGRERSKSERSGRSKKSRHSPRSKSERSGKSRRSRTPRKSSRSSRSRRRSKPREHRCSMDCDECPKKVSRKALVRAAARDRQRREAYSVLQMINAHGMTEPMMLKAMERQKAYEAMRSLALHLEVVCIVVVGILGIFAQRVFNTRGDLNFYMTQMTIELFLLAIVVCNIIAPSILARFVSIIIFVLAVGLDFCHILVVVRTNGIFFKCSEKGLPLQPCLMSAIPTHYHTLYLSSFLLILHLAIVLINVSVAIFYDGCLDYYLEYTPGAPQWVTDLPLHNHDRIAESRRRAQKARISMGDLPPGTTIVRQQEERTVKITRTSPDGKKTYMPEETTITRAYTINAPGMGTATGRRRWKKPADGSAESKKSADRVSSEPKKPDQAAAAKPVLLVGTKSDQPAAAEAKRPDQAVGALGKATPTRTKSGLSPTAGNVCCNVFPCGGDPGSPSNVRQERSAAGKETETETACTNVSRIPALMSQIAMLNNKNLIQKQSDYMY